MRALQDPYAGEITSIDSPSTVGLGQRLWVRVGCWTWRPRIRFVARLLQPPNYSREEAVTYGRTEAVWVPPLHHLSADFELPVSEENKLGPNILEVEFWTSLIWWELNDIKTRENFVQVTEEPVEILPPPPPTVPVIPGLAPLLTIMLFLMIALMIIPMVRRWR